MEPILFRAIVAALLVAFIAHRGYYTRKVQRSAETVVEQPDLGLFSRIANVLALPAFAATLVHIFYPAWVSFGSMPLPDWVRWLGVGVAAAGFGLLPWSQISLGKNWSDTPLLASDQVIVTHGPYRHIRHPIYAAFLLILGSILLISANWILGGAWLAMTALDISARIRAEEIMLRARFRDSYSDYMEKTGTLFPRFLDREKR